MPLGQHNRTFFLMRRERAPLELLRSVKQKDLAAGEFLYRRGESATSIFVVERGRLQLFSHTTEGARVPLYVIRAGECVSEAALFAECYCGDVVAEMSSRVSIFPKAAVLNAFHRQPDLSDEFMSLLTRRFNLLRVRLELRNLQSARERIVQYLRWVSPSGESAITLDRPLKSIAEDLGLSPESFYRTLAELVKEGTITRKKGSILFARKPEHDSDHGNYSFSAVSVREATP